jgi:hypothetical protein
MDRITSISIRALQCKLIEHLDGNKIALMGEVVSQILSSYGANCGLSGV